MKGDATISQRRSWLDRLPLIVTGIVALSAAILAAGNTADMAVRTGAVDVDARGRAYLIPLCLEGAALTFGLLAARRRRVGLPARCEDVMLALTLGFATVVNATHAGGPFPGEGVVLSASAPVVLALSVHGLVRARDVTVALAERAETERLERERKAEVSARRAASRERGEQQLAARPERPSVSGPTIRSAGAIGSAQGDTTKAGADVDLLIDEWLAADPTLTGAQVGERLGVSQATGRRRLSEARARRCGAA